MIDFSDKTNCTGCSACANTCALNCIKMECDIEGFLYPIVDKKVCVNCGQCERVCPVSHHQDEKCNVTAFAAKSKNVNTQRRSSSGGVFFELASYVIEKKGVVYGVALDDNMVAKHIRVSTMEELHRLRGSKYVQSEIGQTYKLIRQDLANGLYVMFTGTPCQVEGLTSYFGKKTQQLLLVDFVCHGVPSPKVLDRYLRELEVEKNSQIIKVEFRNKKVSWRRFSMSISFENGTEITETLDTNIYLRGFIDNLFLRPSCYKCKFKSESRSSDITLADFWGVQDIYPELYDNNGVSLCCVNTPLGQELISSVESDLNINEVDFEYAIRRNSAYYSSVNQNRMRTWFFLHMNDRKMKKLITEAIEPGFLTRIELKIRHL